MLVMRAMRVHAHTLIRALLVAIGLALLMTLLATRWLPKPFDTRVDTHKPGTDDVDANQRLSSHMSVPGAVPLVSASGHHVDATAG